MSIAEEIYDIWGEEGLKCQHGHPQHQCEHYEECVVTFKEDFEFIEKLIKIKEGIAVYWCEDNEISFSGVIFKDDSYLILESWNFTYPYDEYPYIPIMYKEAIELANKKETLMILPKKEDYSIHIESAEFYN